MIKKAVTKILDIFKPEGNNTGLANDRLTNKRLLEELKSHFKSVLDVESVGDRMLYPMSFNILMESSDYNDRKQSLPFILPQVVAAFYGIIEENKKEFSDYTPPAKYWFFQFSACNVGTIPTDNSTPLIVRKGHITTVANLLTFDIKKASNVRVDSNVRVSIKLDDSDVMNDVNVNLGAIQNLDILSEGTFIYNFDNTLNRDTRLIEENSNMAETYGLAELSYSRDGKNYRFSMKDNLIHISGKNEMREGRAFFILENADIKDSHVQIKYVPTEKRFQIAAFGPTRLNSRLLAESSGGDVMWYDLANNSSIFINEEIRVKFEIK